VNLFSRDVCRFQNWVATVELGSYYRDSLVGRLNLVRRFFSELCPLRDLIFARDSMANQQDVDKALDTLALVNALLLTLPFGLMGNLQVANWDALVAARNSCIKCGTYLLLTISRNVLYIYTHVVVDCRGLHIVSTSRNLSSVVLGSVYLCGFSIVATLIYYLCRPRAASDSEKDEKVTCQYYLDPKSRFLHFGYEGRERFEVSKKDATKENDYLPCVKEGDDIEPYIASRRVRNPKSRFVKLFGDLTEKKVLLTRQRKTWSEDGTVEISFSNICRYRFRAWFRRGKFLVTLSSYYY
jgi:hypothetical protein